MSPSPPAPPRHPGRRLHPTLFWALQGGWVVFAVAMSLGRVGELTPAEIVVVDWALAALGFLVTLGLGGVYRRAHARASAPSGSDGAPLGWALGVSLAASYLGAVLWVVAYHLYLRGPGVALLAAFGGDAGRPPAPLGYRGPLLDDAVYHTVVLLAWSAGYFGLRHHAALQAARERALRAEADAQRARLRALRYQLDPHFLFNVLNGVSTLVAEGRGRDATTMLARVADFLRLTLAPDGAPDDGAPEVPLVRELDFVRRYLAVEQARFGDRLRVLVHADDAALAAAVPALLLQPLVENAVRHAIAPRTAGGRITVRAEVEGGGRGGVGGALVLTVADDGPGVAAIAAARGGVGLANVRERLTRIVPKPDGIRDDRYGLELGENEGGGLCARVRLPFRTARATPAAPDAPATPAHAPAGS